MESMRSVICLFDRRVHRRKLRVTTLVAPRKLTWGVIDLSKDAKDSVLFLLRGRSLAFGSRCSAFPCFCIHSYQVVEQLSPQLFHLCWLLSANLEVLLARIRFDFMQLTSADFASRIPKDHQFVIPLADCREPAARSVKEKSVLISFERCNVWIQKGGTKTGSVNLTTQRGGTS